MRRGRHLEQGELRLLELRRRGPPEPGRDGSATMKSRVATSLTFQSDATIDCEPAWLKARGQRHERRARHLLAERGLAAGQDRERVRQERQPGDLADRRAAGLAGSSPARRR